MATEIRRVPNVRGSSVGTFVAALLSAPCLVGTLLIPVGLGALMTSAFFTWLDTYRYVFMAAALVLLVVAHVGLRRARDFRPTRFVWIITILAAALILGELFLDPPWARHANVPM